MNRILFLLALAMPLTSRAPQIPSQPEIAAPNETHLELVGPSVLMNRARETSIAIFDLRASGRAVPGATRNLAAPIENRVVFALGDLETARKWAEKRALESVFVVPPHLIEFQAMRVPQIAPRAAWNKVRRNGWPLFDISEAVEFADSRLPASQRLDFSDFRRGKLSQLPKNRPFIVACRVGHRSQLVTQKLRELGYDARNLSGGLWNWQAEGLPLEGEKR